MKQMASPSRLSNNLVWLSPTGLILLIMIGLIAVPQLTWAQSQPLRPSGATRSPAGDVSPTEDHFVYLPLVTRRYCSSYPCLIYTESFGDPNSGWPVEHEVDPPDHEWHREYLDGTYHMEIDYIWMHRIFAVAPNLTTRDNYMIRVDLKYDFSDYRADWGVIFGATGDPGACYMVTANRYGEDVYYAIRLRAANGGETGLASGGVPRFSLQKNSDKWNRLKITRQGDTIAFDTYNFSLGEWYHIRTVQDATLGGGGIGFTIFSSEFGAEAFYDNLYVWDLGP